MEIFVLDACSRDHTLQFARASGARVVQREWTNFVEARRFALTQVNTPWTLMLDADEALDDVLRDAINAASEACDCYAMRRTTYFCGKPMRIWAGERLLRLFRTDRATLVAHPAAAPAIPIHEAWTCNGEVGALPGTLLHYSYPDVATYRSKYERYTSLEAAGLRPSVARVLLETVKSLPRAMWLLFGRGAFLDGPRGWYVALRSALYPAVAARKALHYSSA